MKYSHADADIAMIVSLLLLSVFVLQPLATNVAANPTGQSTEQLSSAQLQIENVSIEVTFAPGKLHTPREHLLQWISNSAQAVAHYYGRFPVPRLRLLL